MIDRRALLAAGALLAVLPARAAPSALKIKVYKDPSCGCCTAWAERLTAAGFSVEVEARDDMDALRQAWVPDNLVSCHTGVINGYAIGATCRLRTSSACRDAKRWQGSCCLGCRSIAGHGSA
jgi:hypothetical protein